MAPGYDLDQRRLARAIVAKQADDLTRSEIEADVLEDTHASERLRDVAKLKPLLASRQGRRRGPEGGDDQVRELSRLASALALSSRHAGLAGGRNSHCPSGSVRSQAARWRRCS